MELKDHYMEIIDMDWAEPLLLYVLRCKCGEKSRAPTNAMRVRCPGCGAGDLLPILEKRFIERYAWAFYLEESSEEVKGGKQR